MTIELTTPVGRLVGGHPMIGHPVKDDKTNLPKMQADGVTPQVQYYCGLAIAKGTETHWSQTEWGAKIWAEAAAAWAGGEYNHPSFSFKITDGDSQVPNKKMRKPCEREGYPGHWIINASNGFPIKSYHRGMYDPTQVIQQKETIKTGDYCRLVISVKSNQSTQTAGMYVNPSMFELYQAGVEIVTESAADPNATFGADAGVMPANALVDPNLPTQANVAAPGGPANMPGAGPVSPATDFVSGPGSHAGPGAPVPEVKYVTPDGGAWTHAQLIGVGYNDVQIQSLPRG